ncbi:Phosphomethylpyrimidine kinase-domain-containing protein [Lactifluus subvellereus]|nr:Phosphomethylpyrimidine kinase-domain-containing protein [Lactifluus subvellereus]
MIYTFPVDSGGAPPVVLTIAGSDSGGGAGIQADLKTFTALGCYGTSVVTALTAQNTKGVQAVHTVLSSFVEEQLRSVLDDIDVTAVKTGMLANASIVRAVAHTLKAQPSPPQLVVDPVCVSTSGHTLLEHEALSALTGELLPLATVLTPNMAEASLLLRQRTEDPQPITSIEDMLRAARELCALGPRAVLLKGGHMARGGTRLADVEAAVAAAAGQQVLRVRIEYEGLAPPNANMEILLQAAVQDPAASVRRDAPAVVVDVLCERDDQGEGGGGERCTLFVRPYLDSSSTHGTGCTLSAALACALARGDTRTPLTLPVEILSISLCFTRYHRPTPSDPYPLVRMLIRSNAEVWKQYVQHDFVRQLGQGTLSRERFIHFIKQDYLYLKYYARANGLLAAKSTAYADFAAAAETVLAVVAESKMHVSFSAQWGVDLAELERTPESPACTAYGAYIMDIGLQGDAASLMIALATCLLGYGEVGLWVQIENNPYRKWIEDYSEKITRLRAIITPCLERIEALAVHDPPSPKTLEHWKTIWERCTRLEKDFWDMAMNLS